MPEEKERSIADAKLIAAAPDLLEACKGALKALSCVSRHHEEDAPRPGCECYACEAANALKAAIAKATA